MTTATTGPPFAEDSATRVVTREACVLGGAGRAILLQVAHPKVGRGVAEHSRFAEDPMARLRGTLTYVYGIAFGTAEEAEWVAGIVRRIHRHVVGPGYSADDPELQLWVAATLHESAVQAYSMAFGPMPPMMAEELCRQGAFMATALGCPAELWPASVEEFRDYWTRQLDVLEVSDDAKRICHDLLYSKDLPWYVRVLLPVNRFITAGLLPERLRAGYGFVWNRRRDRVFRTGVRLTRLFYRYFPRMLRELPMAYCMRGLHARYQASVAGATEAPRTGS
jgi:uncharacterized protein (DUF2236 family)